MNLWISSYLSIEFRVSIVKFTKFFFMYLSNKMYRVNFLCVCVFGGGGGGGGGGVNHTYLCGLYLVCLISVFVSLQYDKSY